MWKFSNARGLRMALIPCICLGARTLVVFCPILYGCGVLHRLFLHRSFHNLHTDKRDGLHTSCLFTPTILEVAKLPSPFFSPLKQQCHPSHCLEWHYVTTIALWRLLSYLGTSLLLELCLDVGHSALNLLVGKCLVSILEDEAQGV